MASADDLSAVHDNGSDGDFSHGSSFFSLLKSFKHILSHILNNSITFCPAYQGYLQGEAQFAKGGYELLSELLRGVSSICPLNLFIDAIQ